MPDSTPDDSPAQRAVLRRLGVRWAGAYALVTTVVIALGIGNYWVAQRTAVQAAAVGDEFASFAEAREALREVRRSIGAVTGPLNRRFLEIDGEVDEVALAAARAELHAAAARAEGELARLAAGAPDRSSLVLLAGTAAELDSAVVALLGTRGTDAAAHARLALVNYWSQQLHGEIARHDVTLSAKAEALQARIAGAVAASEHHKGWMAFAALAVTLGAAGYGLVLLQQFRAELRRREALHRDLTRSRRELAAQALELRKLSSVARLTNNAVIITDASGAIDWVNEGFERLSGYPLAEVRGRRPGEFLQGRHTDAATVARIRESLAAGRAVDEELLNYAKDGRTYWVRLEIQPVAGDDGRPTHFVAVQSDVSAQKSIQQQLERARDHAVAAASARAQFLANTSHEIRTPMNGVLGMAELLLRTPLDERQKRHAETILRSARHLLAIINDVLDFAKMEAGRFELNPVPTDLREFLDELAAGFEVEARQKGLAFDLSLPPGKLPVVLADASRLRQVLLNLVGNAVKFTTEGGVTLRLGVEPARGREQAVDVRIEVADTGPGIAPEMQRHVFEPFVQANRRVAVEYGGTGLGLPIARQLARLMQGELTLRSEAGRGCTFTLRVRLPAAPAGATTAAEPAAEAGPLGLRVLVAEDYPVNQEVVREALAVLGCTAVIVDDGQAALERYRGAPADFDAILMDCRMPRLDGFEATTAIRNWETAARRAPVPIVALTAGALATDRRRCTEVGMNGFVAKPLVLAELREALAAVA